MKPIYSRQRWEPCEDEFLRANVPATAVADLAKALGRSELAVWVRCRRLRLSRRRLMAQAEAQLRDCHARGLSDPQTARELGFTPEAVYRWRKRNGLPAAMTRQDRGRAMREIANRNAHGQGYDSAQHRAAVRRRLRVDAACPGAATPLEAEALTLLRQHAAGLTAREITGLLPLRHPHAVHRALRTLCEARTLCRTPAAPHRYRIMRRRSDTTW